MKNSEKTTVIYIKCIEKYIYLEDSILSGLEKLSKTANTSEMQQMLWDAVNQFNLLGCKFQDEWDDGMWKIYENARDPRKLKDESAKTHKQISKKLLDLQEIAITLSRMSRGSEGPENKIRPFELIDREAAKYKNATITKELHEKSKWECRIS